MKLVEDYEKIRRAYFVDHCSIREIHRQLGVDRDTIRKAIVHPTPQPYTLQQPRPAPVVGPYQPRIGELLDESEQQNRKQRYTAHKIYELLFKEGYAGSEGAIHNEVSQARQRRKQRKSYLPLEFDPGQDAQVDWGEADAIVAGQRVTVNLFVLRLNYSKARFVMAFPMQRQEAFWEGHIRAFHFFGGVPRRITYDNLKTAVFKLLEGHNRQEQQAFVSFRSYYLFESFYCNPAQGHEKGGVENDVGYVQRNFMTPLPQVGSYAELNTFLEQACRDNLHRHVRGKEAPVLALWEAEQAELLSLPPTDFAACVSYPVKPNGYSQVELDTNRYSVPATYQAAQLVLEAYPFRVRILSDRAVIAEHPRCFGREQDILNPLHYLSLLEQRPGAFEHALPVRRWRQTWPAEYDQLLAELRQKRPAGQGVREFIAILKLHQTYPGALVEAAVRQALELGAAHLDGVQLCLRQLREEQRLPRPLDMQAHPAWAGVGTQAIDLSQYDRLTGQV
ncbi:MAG TPA: IS21 family transposase [Anaerolineaceae bacterium]